MPQVKENLSIEQLAASKYRTLCVFSLVSIHFLFTALVNGSWQHENQYTFILLFLSSNFNVIRCIVTSLVCYKSQLCRSNRDIICTE